MSEPKRSDCRQDCDINCTFPHCVAKCQPTLTECPTCKNDFRKCVGMRDAQSHLRSPDESDPVILWAEIHRLRAAVQGPDGFKTWQEAATAERVRRVAVEKQLKELRAALSVVSEPEKDRL